MENKNKILWGSEKNAVIILIGINLVFFLFFRMLYIIFQNDQQTFSQDYHELISQFVLPSRNFFQKPWTLITYFFSNTGFFSLFTNMLWLFSFSYLLQIVAGNRYLVPSYVYGGLAGGIAYLVCMSFYPNSNGYLSGATCSVISLAATTVAFAPGFKIFPFIYGGIPLWVLFVLFVLTDSISIYFQNPVYLWAHLAAMVTGYFFGILAQRGIDAGNWMHWIYSEFTGNHNTAIQLKKKPPFYYQKKAPFTKEKKQTALNVDTILEKIHQKGIGSLTKEEKNFLNKEKDKL
jgi:membrane associated rhomboid family serine protease